LEYILSLADAGLAEMRALIFELRPESLAREGLVVALTKQADALRARHRLEVLVELCEEPDLPIEAKQALYRIAQEGMNNIIKHARASQVTVSLAGEEAGVRLTVEDNGQGFDPGGDFPGHLGLRSMRERAEHLGGSLEVRSAAGEGTTLTVFVPQNKGD
jgi:signal transduction histidine kinase